VAETFNMSQLRGYGTGGTIHVVIDNQIALPLPPATPTRASIPRHREDEPGAHIPRQRRQARGRRPRDEDRPGLPQEFGSDVVVDIFCYRKARPQRRRRALLYPPLHVRLIQAHPSAAALYGEECVASGLLSKSDAEKMRKDYVARLEAGLGKERAADAVVESAASAGEGAARGAEGSAEGRPRVETRIDEATLSRIVEGISAVPRACTSTTSSSLSVAGKLKTFKEKGLIDWALAEAAAFGSLLLEGVHVRLSGEDSSAHILPAPPVWWGGRREDEYLLHSSRQHREESEEMAVY